MGYLNVLSRLPQEKKIRAVIAWQDGRPKIILDRKRDYSFINSLTSGLRRSPRPPLAIEIINDLPLEIAKHIKECEAEGGF